MSGDLWRGIADGLADSRASSAEAAASRLANEADRAKTDAWRADQRSNQNFERAMQMAKEAQAWRSEAFSLQAEASGYLVTLNAVTKAMDEFMTPMEKERFRSFVANAARGRIQVHIPAMLTTCSGPN